MSELPENSENPQKAVAQPPLVQRLREACNGHPAAKIPWPHRVLHEAADRIETLERTLADYIDKSEKLVYGAHGNAYLPGQMRTWLKATHDGKNLAANSSLNADVRRDDGKGFTP